MAKKKSTEVKELNSAPDRQDAANQAIYRLNVEMQDLIEVINSGRKWTGKQGRRYTDVVWMLALLVK